jgi:type 2 lantibiotic biosynthesis protein LanM
MNDLDRIVARAEPLWARLGRMPVGAYDATLGSARLERWCRRVAGGRWDCFERRLALGGWTRDHCLRVLGTEAISGPERPPWAKTLATIHESALTRERGGASPSSDPVPFEPLLEPMVRVAARRVQGAGCSTALSVAASLAFEHSLLARLSAIAAPTLFQEFSNTLPSGPDIIGHLIGRDGRAGTNCFDRFVQQQLDDGYRSLFLEYPVLARLLATAVDQWVAATTEFASRFSADRQILGGASVVQLEAGLSDPHAHGRTVVKFETDRGAHWIYKPRRVDGEALLANLCAWFTKRAPIDWLPLWAPAAIPRAGYGWVELAEEQPCRDRGGVERYFDRMGQLLGLLHALQATDINRENLVAHREYPVLVDGETLLQPSWSSLEASGAPGSFTAPFLDFAASVAGTGGLPAWEHNPIEGTCFDLAGLGSNDTDRSPVRAPQFYDVNTDRMLLLNEFGPLPPAANVVTLDGRAVHTAEFQCEVLRGYERAHRLLREHKDALCGRDGLAADLRALEPRVILRDTRIYLALLALARRRANLRDGIDYSVELDRVSQAFLEGDALPGTRRILDAELDALEHGDVPYFAVAATSRDFAGVPDFFAESAWQRANRVLSGLREEDLGPQSTVIRGALQSQRAHIVPDAWRRQPALDDAGPATPEQLIVAAQAIAREIRTSVVCTGSAWIGVRQVADSGRYRLMPLGDDLYSGRVGIVLFLAALARVTGSTEDAALIQRALGLAGGGWRAGSASWQARWLRALGCGAMHGVASLSYGMLAAGRLLERTDFTGHAVDLARLLTPELMAGDREFGVASGSAGALLVLIRLHAHSGEPEFLRAAVAGGDALLAHRTQPGVAPRAWPFRGGPPLAGFYLGAAGISYALLNLYAVTGDGRYLDAARESMRYEDTLYDAAAGNWRDLRPRHARSPRSPFMTSWCHGAPGIGLARMAGLGVCDDAVRRGEVERGLVTTAACPLDDVDHLCCGNLGRLDVLWTAGLRLERPELQDAALRRAGLVLARARATGGYRLAPGLLGAAVAPSLFCGSAGIGYQFLRLAQPAVVPSVLLLE